jgi:hypothetical protein
VKDNASKGRDAALLSALPPKDSPYSFDNLNEAETAALTLAFGDGFGDVGVVGSEAKPLPSEIRSGLLHHTFFVGEYSEYGHEENPGEFWERDEEKGQGPSDSFPLEFVLRRLRLYFANQLDRFCAQLIRENPQHVSDDRDYLVGLAVDRLYEKPWYEFHAIKILDYIEMSQRDLYEKKNTEMSQRDFVEKNYANFFIVVISSWSGQLGRLVEQYYWRLRFEKVTIAGVGARKGAAAGGKAKAELHKLKHAAWQKAASEIWARRPNLNKIAVAQALKKQLPIALSAKHIARFIKRP